MVESKEKNGGDVGASGNVMGSVHVGEAGAEEDGEVWVDDDSSGSVGECG